MLIRQEPRLCNLKVEDIYAVTARPSKHIDQNLFHHLGISDTFPCYFFIFFKPPSEPRLLLMSPTVDGSKNNRLNRLLVSRHSISPVYPAPDELLAALQASVHTCTRTHTRSINAHAPAGCPLKGKQSGRPPAQLELSAWRVFGRSPRRICSLHYLHSARFHQCRLRFHCAAVLELI